MSSGQLVTRWRVVTEDLLKDLLEDLLPDRDQGSFSSWTLSGCNSMWCWIGVGSGEPVARLPGPADSPYHMSLVR